jgi:hypothetical protein
MKPTFYPSTKTSRKRSTVIAAVMVLFIIGTVGAIAISQTLHYLYPVGGFPQVNFTASSTPSSITKGNSTNYANWTFGMTVNPNPPTLQHLKLNVRIYWVGYVQGNSYTGMFTFLFNGTAKAFTGNNGASGIVFSYQFNGKNNVTDYIWLAGDSSAFTTGIAINTAMPNGGYTFDFWIDM